MGKFTACAVASYAKCYFQDDLWLNPYLDSLYTHSFRFPDHLVANTRPVNYVDYMRWRFSNKGNYFFPWFKGVRRLVFIYLTLWYIQRSLFIQATQIYVMERLFLSIKYKIF